MNRSLNEWQERKRRQREWARLTPRDQGRILRALAGPSMVITSRPASDRRRRKFERRAAAAAERIRRDPRWRACSCVRADPGPGGTCGRCYGELAA